ncbi:MAG: PKD domain-containing protein, partial [Nitrososphaera sp.]
MRFGGTPNAPADADAGPDQTVGRGVPVTLDGSRSCDVEGDPFTYSWTQTAGPSVTLFGSTTANPTFTSPFVLDDTVLTFQLTVTGGGTSSDTVNVTVGGKVASSSDTRLESSGEQRVSYFDGTRHWVFYYSGTNIRYKYSADGGLTWSGEALSPVSNLAANSYFGVYGEGNTVIVSASNTTMAYTRKGTISGETINWNPSQLVFAVSGMNSPGQNYYPSFEKVGTSDLFLAFNIIDKGKNVGYVYRSTNLGDSWTQSTKLHTNQGISNPAIVGVAKYGSNKAIAVFAEFGGTEFKYKLWSPNSWTMQASSTVGAGLVSGSKTNAFSSTSDATCAWVGYVPSNTGGQLRAIQFCDSGGSLIYVVKELTTGTNLYPTMGSENGNVQLVYLQGGIIRAITNLNNGGNTVWQ